MSNNGGEITNKTHVEQWLIMYILYKEHFQGNETWFWDAGPLWQTGSPYLHSLLKHLHHWLYTARSWLGLPFPQAESKHLMKNCPRWLLGLLNNVFFELAYCIKTQIKIEGILMKSEGRITLKEYRKINKNKERKKERLKWKLHLLWPI